METNSHINRVNDDDENGSKAKRTSTRNNTAMLAAVGVLIIVVGVFFLLGEFNVLPFDWGVVWPLVLVVVGGYFLITSPRSSIWWAPISIFFGIVFFIGNLGVIPDMDTGEFLSRVWPFAIIFVGLAFVVNALLNQRDRRRGVADGERDNTP